MSHLFGCPLATGPCVSTGGTDRVHDANVTVCSCGATCTCNDLCTLNTHTLNEFIHRVTGEVLARGWTHCEDCSANRYPMQKRCNCICPDCVRASTAVDILTMMDAVREGDTNA